MVKNKEIICIKYDYKKGEFIIRLGRDKENPSWEYNVYQTITINNQDREFEKMMNFYMNIY